MTAADVRRLIARGGEFEVASIKIRGMKGLVPMPVVRELTRTGEWPVDQSASLAQRNERCLDTAEGRGSIPRGRTITRP